MTLMCLYLRDNTEVIKKKVPKTLVFSALLVKGDHQTGGSQKLLL